MKPRTCERCYWWDRIADTERGLCRPTGPVQITPGSVFGEWLQTNEDDRCPKFERAMA